MKIKWLVFIAVIVSLGCSEGTVTNVVFAQKNSSPSNTNATVEKTVESPIKPIGTFMNVKSDGEHSSGYLIKLWKQDDKIYGLISAHRGLMGDPPTGSLESVQFDSKTGKLSFKSKLSLGLYLSKDSPSGPSHDVFQFEGTLSDKKLEGNLKTTNELCPDKCPETKKINLPRSDEWSEGMKDYQSYADWKIGADEVLQRRGPTW